MTSGQGVRIRPAVATDAAAIADAYSALHRDQWASGGAEPPHAEHEPNWLAEVTGALASAEVRLFVAVVGGGGVVGTARVEFGERPYFRIADIRRVYVRPEWRRRGVASELMRVAEEAAREGGAQEVRLSVVAENEPALLLYRRLGYRQFAIRLAKRV